MPHLTIRGVDHYYQWVRTADQPTGKPVMVFLHGWAGSTRYWETTAEALKSQFDCLLYDLRGFGQSLLPRPVPEAVEGLGYELESYADDLALLLDALGLERIYLNAHSTGTSVAVLFLNRYPDRVVRAILTCGGVFEYDKRSFDAFHRFSGYVVGFRPNWLQHLPYVDRLFMTRFLRRSIPRSASRAFLEDFLIADFEAALGTAKTAVSQRAAEEMPHEFIKLTVPTLLISGEYDKIIPAQLGERAAALNPLVKQIVMPGTAHFPMLEDPTAYLTQVRQFLQSQPDPIATS